MLRSRIRQENTFVEKRVLLPPPRQVNAFSRTHVLLRLQGAGGLFHRWPELWRVIRGDMGLIGNRPLSPEETTALRGPAAHLWMESAAGVFSLADAQGDDGDSIRESVGHAAYFSTHSCFSLKLRILARCLLQFIHIQNPANGHLPAPLPAFP